MTPGTNSGGVYSNLTARAAYRYGSMRDSNKVDFVLPTYDQNNNWPFEKSCANNDMQQPLQAQRRVSTSNDIHSVKIRLCYHETGGQHLLCCFVSLHRPINNYHAMARSHYQVDA